MLPPWFGEVCVDVVSSFFPFLPPFFCVFVGIAALFCVSDVSDDEDRVFLFAVAVRTVGIILLIIGVVALFQVYGSFHLVLA